MDAFSGRHLLCRFKTEDIFLFFPMTGMKSSPPVLINAAALRAVGKIPI
jgi:hypothetical protein